MIQIGEDTIMIGATEFRAQMPKWMKTLQNKKVILMKRGKPVAVLQDFETFKAEEEMIDEFEDLVLGHIAKERFESSKEENLLTLEEAFEDLSQ